MNNTLVFIDSGFLSKLSKHFGKGKYINYDIIQFAKNLAERQSLLCQHIFYFCAPPFQSDHSTKDEDERKKRYDKFIAKIKKNPLITIEEGRVQKIKLSDGGIKYSQKGVDSLLSMALGFVPLDFPFIKEVILIASDTDFCPIIDKLKLKGVEVILYSYYEKKRESSFSRSHHLIDSCSKYIKLTKEDFDNACLVKNKEGLD